MNSLITAITNFIRIYLIRRFIVVFLNDVKPDKKKEVLVCGVFFVVSTGAYFIFHLTYINVICSIAGISMMVLLRTKSIKMYFLVTYSVYFINLMCDCLVVPLFVDYTEGEEFNQIFVIVETLLIFMCELAAEKIIWHKRKEDVAQRIPLILVPLLSVIAVLFLVKIDDREAMPVMGISLLIINFLVFYLYDIVVKAVTDQYENELLQQQMQIYANQMEVIMQGEKKVKSLRHDMKHHLNELKYLADKKEKGDVLAYIGSMESFLQNPDEMVASGNVEMDSLLNYMLRQAEKNLTTVNIKVNIPENIIPAFDINVILGNLLENAIRAAQQSEEKFLEMSMDYDKGMLIIEIKNSFSGELHKSQNGLLTTKTKKEGHGIGLSSVEQVVKKYNGLLKTGTQDRYFYVNILLYCSQF